MDLKVQKMLAETVTNVSKNTVSPYNTTAKVTSITDDTVYVQIPGSENSTPVKARSVSVKVGDTVDLSVSHSDTHITGNRSDVAVSQTTADSIASDVEANKLLLDNEIVMTGNKIKAVNNNINLINNNMDIQNSKIEVMDSTITAHGSSIEAIDSTVKMQGSSIETINSNISNIDSTVKSQGSKISTLESTVNTQGSSIETINSNISNIDSTLETHGSSISALDSNVKIINTAFVIKDGKLTGISEIVTGILDAGYVTTDLLNASVGWIENGKIKEGAIGTVEIADSSITTAKIKELSADTIKTGTLKTECLILTTDEVDPETGEKKVALITALNAKTKSGEGNILDGAVIADDTITASKITVVDLKAFGATIGNFTIDTSNIHNGKTGLTDPTNGIYIGTDGIALGQGSLLDMTDDSPFRVESDGDFHLGGKNSNYINFDAFNGELNIDAKSIKMGSSSIATVKNVSDAKDAAISAAASDATTKANAAKTDAISTVNETLKNYATLEVTNNKISSAVTETKAYTDAIQIGGRNLILHSDKWNSSGTGATGITPSRENDMLKVVVASGNGNWHRFFTDDVIEANLNDGDSFTFSIEIKSDDGTVPPDIYFKSGLGYFRMKGTVSSDFSWVYYTGTWKKANDIAFHFGWSASVGTYYIRKIKFEKGNKATDWTPAPEDVNEASVTEAKSYVDQTVESITATVQGVDGRLSKMEQNASGFTWTIDETAIVSSVNEYYKSTSATSLSGGSWSTSQPTWSEGTYIWMRTKNTNGKGTVSYTTAVCITGNTGATGAKGDKGDTGSPGKDGTDGTNGKDGAKGDPGTPGKDGTNGKDGRGISSTAVTYQAGSSGTTVPTGTWSSSIPSVSAGQYLWTKTVTSYTSGNPTTAYSVGRMGTNGTNGSNGSNGSDGKGIKSTAITYQVWSSGTSTPTGTWSTSVPSITANNPYLWTKTVITYTDNNTSTSYSVGAKGDGLDVKDTRNDNQPPSWYMTNYPKTTAMEFKDCSKIGLSEVGTYCALQTIVPWNDASGGYPKQTAKVEGTGKEYWRVGTSASAWSSWVDPYGTAVNSAKTATNYMNFANNGLTIGNMTASTLGKNVLIDSDSVDIRNGSTVLASYGENISLYKDGVEAFTIKDSELLENAVNLNNTYKSSSSTVTSSGVEIITSSVSDPITLETGKTYKWSITTKNSIKYHIVTTPTQTYSNVVGLVWSSANKNLLGINNKTSTGANIPCIYLDNHATVDLALNGSVWVNNNGDLNGKAKGLPPLSIGTNGGEHLEIDGNEITAKSNDTTPSHLYLNMEGGNVSVNNNCNRSIMFQNGAIYAKKMSGSYADKWFGIVDGFNESNNTTFGYGNYLNSIGETNVYGYEVNNISKTQVVLKSENKNATFTVGDNNSNVSTNTSFVVPNGKSFVGTNTSGDLRNNFQPCNTNNNCVIGYGSYSAKEGATNIYGDYLSLTTNLSYIMNNKAMVIPTISVCSVTTQTLKTSAAQIAVGSFNSTNNQTTIGSTYFKSTNGGVKCLLSGWVKVSAQISLTGLTNGDGVNLYIYKNSTNMCFTYTRLNTSGEISIIDHVFKVAANDMIYIYGRNVIAARGTINNNWYGASLTVTYVN